MRRLIALTLAALAMGTVLASTASAALPGPGLPPVGDSCAMQEYLGFQNVRACEDS